ncbi:Chaperone protein DnaJ [Linum perenne]
MDREGGSNGGGKSSYYAVLGIRKDASSSDVRSAYRRLAMRWHPDKWSRNPGLAAADAKRRFQQIQEAYSGEFWFHLCLSFKFQLDWD